MYMRLGSVRRCGKYGSHKAIRSKERIMSRDISVVKLCVKVPAATLIITASYHNPTGRVHIVDRCILPVVVEATSTCRRAIPRQLRFPPEWVARSTDDSTCFNPPNPQTQAATYDDLANLNKHTLLS